MPCLGESRTPSGTALIVMPAYNEAERIGSLLVELRDRYASTPVLVIDDGSADRTTEVAAAAGAIVVRLPFNLGYGAALQAGYKYAVENSFDYVVQMDADGQHRPCDVAALLKCLTEPPLGDVDLVIGSRFISELDRETGPPKIKYEMGLLRSLARRTLCAFARVAGLRLTDPTSGFQAMNRQAVELFASSWYPFDYPDLDVLLLAHRRGLRLREYPVDMAPSPRPSTLHSGWLPIYYAYRMILSLWALSAVPKLSNRASDRGLPGARASGKEE